MGRDIEKDALIFSRPFNSAVQINHVQPDRPALAEGFRRLKRIVRHLCGCRKIALHQTHTASVLNIDCRKDNHSPATTFAKFCSIRSPTPPLFSG